MPYNLRPLGQEIIQLLPGAFAQVQEFPVQEVLEHMIKLVFVVKQVRIGRVVHHFVQLPVLHPGHVGGPLRCRHVVKGEDHIVIITGAVFGGAAQHIEENGRLGLAAAFMDRVDAVVHFFQPHPPEHPGQIGKFHRSVSPFRKFPRHYTSRRQESQCFSGISRVFQGKILQKRRLSP